MLETESEKKRYNRKTFFPLNIVGRYYKFLYSKNKIFPKKNNKKIVLC